MNCWNYRYCVGSEKNLKPALRIVLQHKDRYAEEMFEYKTLRANIIKFQVMAASKCITIDQNACQSSSTVPIVPVPSQQMTPSSASASKQPSIFNPSNTASKATNTFKLVEDVTDSMNSSAQGDTSRHPSTPRSSEKMKKTKPLKLMVDIGCETYMQAVV
jgi:hypothetical protein